VQTAVAVPVLDRSILTPILCEVLRHDVVEVTEWTSALLHEPVSVTTGGVFRVVGMANTPGRTGLPWSVVLKVVVSAPEMDDPSLDQYWKREILAYESGFLQQLRGPLVAATCHGITVRPDGQVWIWLEEIADDLGPDWPIERLETAARHLGRFNGTYAGSRAPDAPWLARGFLRSWVSQGVTRVGARLTALEQLEILQDPHSWEHDLLRMTFPAPPIDRLTRLWENHERLLDGVDRLPRILSHGDANSANLFTRKRSGHEDQTVAIDWAFLGIAGIGEEAGNFATWPVAYLAKTTPTEVTDRVLFDAYLSGLREAGWLGDTRLVRFGYAAHAALRWGFRPVTNLLIETRSWPAVASADRPYPDWLISWATATAAQNRFTLDRGDEANGFLSTL
jgi:hypothetical protein